MSIKLAAYLDEIHDDPDKAGEVLVSKKITGVCLRRAWCRDISSMPDNAIGILGGILSKHNLTPVLLHTDIGCVDPEKLAAEEPKIVRAMQICKFLKCRSIRVGFGISTTKNVIEQVQSWSSAVSRLSISYDMMVLFEPDNNSYYNQPAAVAIFLNKHKRINLLFDPAMLVMQSKINPFVKFWSLLKSRVDSIDIHDFKSRVSAKPAGIGDAQLDIIVADAISSNFTGWFCLEPGLGRRYGDATTKEKTFECAFDAFESLLKRVQLPKIL
jgi:hypothetical protein